MPASDSMKKTKKAKKRLLSYTQQKNTKEICFELFWDVFWRCFCRSLFWSDFINCEQEPTGKGNGSTQSSHSKSHLERNTEKRPRDSKETRVVLLGKQTRLTRLTRLTRNVSRVSVARNVSSRVSPVVSTSRSTCRCPIRWAATGPCSPVDLSATTKDSEEWKWGSYDSYIT